MLSALNNKVKEAHTEGKQGGYQFNCWGATLYVLRERKTLCWLYEHQMQEWLNTKTKRIYKKDLQVGDIIVLYYKRLNYTKLEHTAVYLGFNKWFHKKGSNESEITTFEGIRKTYKPSECNVIKYRRLK